MCDCIVNTTIKVKKKEKKQQQQQISLKLTSFSFQDLLSDKPPGLFGKSIFISRESARCYRESCLFIQLSVAAFPRLVLSSEQLAANNAAPNVCLQMEFVALISGKHIDISKFAWRTEFITSRRDLPFGTGAVLPTAGEPKGQRDAYGRDTRVHLQPKKHRRWCLPCCDLVRVIISALEMSHWHEEIVSFLLN